LTTIKDKLTQINRLDAAIFVDDLIQKFGVELGLRTIDELRKPPLNSGNLRKFKIGLVAYYPFNGNARDESGNGHHGVVKGLKLTNDRHNRLGKAYSFPGQNGKHISLESSPSLHITGNLTVSAWVKFKGGKEDPRIVSNQGTPKVVIGTQGTGDSRKFFVEFSGGRRLHSARSYSSGVWYHVVVVRSGSEIGIYVSGMQIGTSYAKAKFSKGASSGTPTGFCCIGGSAHRLTDAWGGAIDEIRFYNRALSKKEVMDLYGLESSRLHP